jgi:hypothetical protein
MTDRGKAGCVTSSPTRCVSNAPLTRRLRRRERERADGGGRSARDERLKQRKI